MKTARVQAGALIARALLPELRRLDRRAWSVGEYREADWTHGYCLGERAGFWRQKGGKLSKAASPRLLDVPYAQFCANGDRVLVEYVTSDRRSAGVVFGIARGAVTPLPDGVKWRTRR
jgi:hypothetical protein